MSTVTGAIKVIDVPDDTCLTTVRDLMIQLEQFLAVEFDSSQVTNVVVSTQEPDATTKDVIWFKTSNSGSFVGIFVFVQGQWIQMFPTPNGIFKMYGSSKAIPTGYMLVSKDIPGFNLEMETMIRSSWVDNPDDSTEWILFDVVYVGV